MNPRDLDKERLIEKGALTEKNGCSIFALAGAISILEPTLSETQLTEKVKSLISTPIESTPLYEISLKKKLPAPLLLQEGSVTALMWIIEGEGDALMQYLNNRFDKLNLNVAVGYKERSRENDSEMILESVKAGEVYLLPCSVFTNGAFESNHHIAFAFEKDKYIIDINNPVAEVNESLMRAMLEDPDKKITYGDDGEQIAINSQPIIYLKNK